MGDLIRVFEGPEELARAVVEEFIHRAGNAIRGTGRFTVALSGGTTPRRFFRLLASGGLSGEGGPIPWGGIHFFWGDERAVPPDHPDSNFRSARETLFSRVPIPESNLHRIRTDNGNVSRAASVYEDELRRFFRLSEKEFPRFDLILLGMGADGHTASLFPGSEAVSEERRLVVSPWVEEFRAFRVTLTLPVINHARCVILMVSGEEKAETLRNILEGVRRAEPYPVQRVRPEAGEWFWFLDRDAARLLHVGG